MLYEDEMEERFPWQCELRGRRTGSRRAAAFFAADAMQTHHNAVYSGEMIKAPHGLGKAKTRRFTLWSDGVLLYHASRE